MTHFQLVSSPMRYMQRPPHIPPPVLSSRAVIIVYRCGQPSVLFGLLHTISTHVLQ